MNGEFGANWAEVDSLWRHAGAFSVSEPDSVYHITAIPNYVQIDNIPVESAIAGDNQDDAPSFRGLINWIANQQNNYQYTAQIHIPPGVYNFSDQIIMSSNISLKGAGSHQTELRFLIRADSTSSTMSETDCRKDAILVAGSDDNILEKVGIEDLKIVRIRDGLSEREVKDKVGDHISNGTSYSSYWGNNIAIRRGTNCWVKGVESENTFRNHVTLEYAHNNTISGVYFHDANDYGDGGYGYGVGVWDSWSNKIENSIFRHLRHAVTIVDKSWFNVVAYNYVREQHSTKQVPYIGEISTHWSDITIHGESYNTWQSEENPSIDIDSLRTPYYNLIEGNNLDYLCVDATHQHNGSNNTFLRNRVIEQIHVQGYDGFPDALTTAIAGSLVLHPLAVAYLAVDYYVDGPIGSVYGRIGLVGLVDYLVSSYTSLQFCCRDCAIMRIVDQVTYLIPGTSDDTFKFQNQPRQLFVNNHARDYHWWRNQILDYPVRMHSEIDQFQVNTYKRYYNWWGTRKGKTINEYTPYECFRYSQPICGCLYPIHPAINAVIQARPGWIHQPASAFNSNKFERTTSSNLVCFTSKLSKSVQPYNHNSL